MRRTTGLQSSEVETLVRLNHASNELPHQAQQSRIQSIRDSVHDTAESYTECVKHTIRSGPSIHGAEATDRPNQTAGSIQDWTPSVAALGLMTWRVTTLNSLGPLQMRRVMRRPRKDQCRSLLQWRRIYVRSVWHPQRRHDDEMSHPAARAALRGISFSGSISSQHSSACDFGSSQ